MSDENEKPDLLGFFAEDHRFIKELAKAVRDLIGRPTTTPEQMHHLARLLFALNRLPRPTSGLCIELTLGQRHENDESDHLCLTLDDSRFCLAKVLYIVIDPSVGGDTAAETIFEVEGQSRELVEPSALMGWVEAFRGRIEDPVNELEISDAAESSEFDWEAESSDADWDNLESDYA